MQRLIPISWLMALTTFLGAAEPTKQTSAMKIEGALRELRSTDAVVRQRAKLQLLAAGQDRALTDAAPKLVPLLADFATSPESGEILGLLPIPAVTRERLLSLETTPLKVKARLGDAAAESAIIAKFQDADNPASKRTYALELLYIGSPKAMQAFATALANDKVYTDVHGNPVSLVQLLLHCYGSRYPEYPLFSAAEYQKHAGLTPDRFKGKEHQDYLREIEKHFADKWAIALKVSPAFLPATQRPGILIQDTK